MVFLGSSWSRAQKVLQNLLNMPTIKAPYLQEIGSQVYSAYVNMYVFVVFMPLKVKQKLKLFLFA